eukprot:12900783-Prorocentrum_lima.AAC.1
MPQGHERQRRQATGTPCLGLCHHLLMTPCQCPGACPHSMSVLVGNCNTPKLNESWVLTGWVLNCRL